MYYYCGVCCACVMFVFAGIGPTQYVQYSSIILCILFCVAYLSQSCSFRLNRPWYHAKSCVPYLDQYDTPPGLDFSIASTFQCWFADSWRRRALNALTLSRFSRGNYCGTVLRSQALQ